MKKPVNKPTKLKWTKTKPTKPGWYWCQNVGDIHGGIWEAPVRIDRIDGKLFCCWLAAPTHSDILAKEDWSPKARWAGPIQPPFQGKLK